MSLVLYGLNLLLVPHLFFYPENQQYLLQNFSVWNILGQLPIFFMGILSYFIYTKNYPPRQIAIISGMLFVVLLTLFLYPVSIIPHHLIAGGMFSVFVLLLAHWPTRLLVNRITTLVGKLSFSMYLVQFAILQLFRQLGISGLFPQSNLGSILHFLCPVPVVAFVSFYLYRYIEKPGIAQGRRLIEMFENDVTRNTRMVTAPQAPQSSCGDPIQTAVLNRTHDAELQRSRHGKCGRGLQSRGQGISVARRLTDGPPGSREGSDDQQSGPRRSGRLTTFQPAGQGSDRERQ